MMSKERAACLVTIVILSAVCWWSAGCTHAPSAERYTWVHPDSVPETAVEIGSLYGFDTITGESFCQVDFRDTATGQLLWTEYRWTQADAHVVEGVHEHQDSLTEFLPPDSIR